MPPNKQLLSNSRLPSSGDRPSGSDSDRDAGQSGDRTDEDPLKETQTTDGPMDDGTDTHLKG